MFDKSHHSLLSNWLLCERVLILSPSIENIVMLHCSGRWVNLTWLDEPLNWLSFKYGLGTTLILFTFIFAQYDHTHFKGFGQKEDEEQKILNRI